MRIQIMKDITMTTRRTFILLLYLLLYTCAKGENAGGMQQGANNVLPDDTATWTGRMQRRLDSLVNLPLFKTTQLGLYVRDLTDRRDLFCINAQHRMRPASNQKIVTAVAALHYFNDEYLLRTRMLLTGEVRDSVLWGDLCFIGGMDPLFSQGEVLQMARTLKEIGVDSIAGIVRIDLTMKDQNPWGWGWCWDDDMTPLSPLLVDKKDRFANELISSLRYAAVKGIDIDRIVQAPCPSEARLIYEIGHSVDQVLPRMMKKSDNYYAESLFYQLAALSGKKAAGQKEARGYIDALIRKVGLTPAHYEIADGSGVSLYNYLTPELLIRLLEYAWREDHIRQRLYPSLSIAGVDGTLEKRMQKTPAQGNIHAKTGTVTGVSSLSGYATSPEGHVIAFSIINMGIPRAQVGRDWQDKVCIALCTP